MLKNFTTLLVAVVCCFNLAFCQSVYTGQVSDADTNESLVFVSIQLLGTTTGTTTGTTSDLDGNFELMATAGDSILLSYVGYEDQVLVLGVETNLKLRLNATAVALNEIVVRPKENPAWRIIREVIGHRQENDPQLFPGYSYEAYHKTVLSVDSLVNVNRKQLFSKRRSSERKERDSIRQAVFLNDMHMWVTETRSENYFRAPQQRSEKILATQSSLPNDFTGGINPINFQPFGFYQPIIRLEFSQQNYVNPISENPFGHYDFLLADTIFHELDTTYIIQFQPLANKYFTALKGLLYVNTDGYALENVIAEPADTLQTVQFVIKQQSKRLEGIWFPEQLHADLFFQIGVGKNLIVYGFRNRSLISEVDFTPPEPQFFNHYLKEINTDLPVLEDSLRELSLNRRERNTYVYWDSLPALRQPYQFLKVYNGLVGIMASGLISTKVADIVIPDLIQVNAREGTRLGLGLKTNPRLSSICSVYAYGGYGLEDKSWKYGGNIEGKLYSHRDLRLRLSYKKDIIEPGDISYLTSSNQPWSAWSTRDLILSRLDDQRQYRAEIIYRPASSWQLNAYWQQEERLLSYDYSYELDAEPSQNSYENESCGLRLRYAPREQLVRMDQLEAILYPAFPVIDLSLSHNSLKETGDDFTRISARLEHEKNWKYFGVTEINLQAGWVSTSVPYPYMFQTPGNAGNGLAGNGLFNSAGPTEFANESFAYCFLTHRFGTLLGRTKTPYFRPELMLMQQIGWGKIRQPERHQGLDLQDMRKGYFETGVGIDNIIRIPYFKLIYIGLGGTAFYRWGPYRLPEFNDNLSFQLRLTFSV